MKCQVSFVSIDCQHRFSIDKLDDINTFSIDLDIDLCIDSSCEAVSVFDNLQVPIPVCNTDFSSLVLPGVDGSIQGFVQELGQSIGDTAINAVIEKLGLAVSIV